MIVDSNVSDTEMEEIPNDIKLRQINCELNPLTRSDGSAFFTQGNTAVLASMYGPIEVKMNNLKIHNASVEVTYRPKSGLPSVKDRFRESIIKNTCETALITALHPRTAITIQLQEMENCCGIEACAVNAACLALLIGGIAMKFTVAAIHCIINKNKDLILDPDSKQALDSIADFTFVFDSLQTNLVAVNTNGKFNLAQYNDAMTLSKAASEIIFKFYRRIVQKLFKIKE